jgi:hypothetical protein
MRSSVRMLIPEVVYHLFKIREALPVVSHPRSRSGAHHNLPLKGSLLLLMVGETLIKLLLAHLQVTIMLISRQRCSTLATVSLSCLFLMRMIKSIRHRFSSIKLSKVIKRRRRLRMHLLRQIRNRKMQSNDKKRKREFKI